MRRANGRRSLAQVYHATLITLDQEASRARYHSPRTVTSVLAHGLLYFFVGPAASVAFFALAVETLATVPRIHASPSSVVRL